MNGSHTTSPLALAALLTALLAGCGNDGADAKVEQTRFPGQVSAGGGTSGEVMAQAKSSAAQAAGKNAGQEGVRAQAPGGSVGGTPSIPEGSGGTTSGAEMGGASSGAAASQTAPPPGGPAPTAPSREDGAK